MSLQATEIVLIDNKDKNPYRDLFTETGSFGGFTWAKACRTDTPNTFEIMQGFVSCKDYVMDTQFRGQSYYNAANWNNEQIRDNCIILYTTTPYITQLQHHLTSFLNPLEISMGMQPTEIKQITRIQQIAKKPMSRLAYVLYGDNKWNIHGNAWSTYLSLIRAMAHTETNKVLRKITSYFRACSANEQSYYTTFDMPLQAFIKNVTNDIDQLLQPVPEGYDPYTGYKGNAPGHGSLGTFYLTGQLTRLLAYPAEYKKVGMVYEKDGHFLLSAYIKKVQQ